MLNNDKRVSDGPHISKKKLFPTGSGGPPSKVNLVKFAKVQEFKLNFSNETITKPFCHPD
jgi:hypothetical protein